MCECDVFVKLSLKNHECIFCDALKNFLMIAQKEQQQKPKQKPTVATTILKKIPKLRSHQSGGQLRKILEETLCTIQNPLC